MIKNWLLIRYLQYETLRPALRYRTGSVDAGPPVGLCALFGSIPAAPAGPASPASAALAVRRPQAPACRPGRGGHASGFAAAWAGRPGVERYAGALAVRCLARVIRGAACGLGDRSARARAEDPRSEDRNGLR